MADILLTRNRDAQDSQMIENRDNSFLFPVEGARFADKRYDGLYQCLSSSAKERFRAFWLTAIDYSVLNASGKLYDLSAAATRVVIKTAFSPGASGSSAITQINLQLGSEGPVIFLSGLAPVMI